MVTLTALTLSGLGLALGGRGTPLILSDCEGVGEWGVLPLLCDPCLLSEPPPGGRGASWDGLGAAVKLKL